MESDIYETRELNIKLAHGVGQAFDEVELQSRGSIVIRNFKGPKYSVDQGDLSEKFLENMKVEYRIRIAERNKSVFICSGNE